ncbi:glucose-6-phosphate 1-epimerase [Rhodoferax sp. OV413]|uniref:D-hexose-6-phosphate mutarotase n=1 Tax=Rhodoferax sp. OV413 TaxID=1855285 RepID=UPI00088BA691|nr:D-hexose-6-phosphate mutarotase [Rhodoferax sp. OV413]SDO41034.1 glucose-6-phosphate 1-epimerase [Rhodoferax sp. OV413]
MSDLQISAETLHHQPCLRLRHACGDSVLVAVHGAHILSWTSDGRERLYLSPNALFDGRSALRGGVPLCFPQFNMRGPLPKHGFARTSAWTAGTATDAEADALELQLHSSPATLALWPYAFRAMLRVELAPGILKFAFSVHNTGSQPLDFALALHTYLRVQNLARLELHGLAAQPYWDDVAQTNRLEPGVVRLDGEVDRVYQAPAGPLILVDGAQQLRIAQSENLADTVVWNPGAAKCASIADMPADGYLQMVCVEAAQVNTPITLAADAHWTGWQSLSLV